GERVLGQFESLDEFAAARAGHAQRRFQAQAPHRDRIALGQRHSPLERPDRFIDLALAQVHVTDREPSEHLAQRMQRLARELDRALRMRRRRLEIAAFRQDADEPHAAADRGNHRQLEAVARALLQGLDDALVEQLERLAVVADEVIALPDAVQQLGLQAALADRLHQAQDGFARGDRPALLRGEEMLVAPERSEPRGAVLVAQVRYDRLDRFEALADAI